MLLGAGVWSQIIIEEIVHLSNGMVRQASRVGHLVFGEDLSRGTSKAYCAVTLTAADASLTKMLGKMWELECYGDTKPMSADDAWCQQNFTDRHYRDADGRYVVTLPINPKAPPLGDSRRAALQQFYRLEGRFKKDPVLAENYIQFMREYEQTGHMIEVDPDLDRGGPCYHIPHHAVKKKFRVVLNASAPTTSGQSLNTIQFVGPRLQADITEIVTNFRKSEIAFCADIEKMYRQVALHPDQWNYQRIFWREDSKLPLKEYWIVRITYGVAASGYNAVRALHQCADDHVHEHPRGAELVKTAFYVDDLLASADTREDALSLKQDTIDLLAKGGFPLAKWISNDPALMEPNSNDNPDAWTLDPDENPSVLGLKWDPRQDHLMIKVKTQPQPRRLTKRQLVSECARIYDPLVLLAPITIVAKMFIKGVWAADIGWYEHIPEEMQARWNAYYAGLPTLAGLRIPRWVGCTADSESQLHIFADASELALGAVAYLVTRSSAGIRSCVLMSISRLAPKAATSMPRLELTAATLAVSLKNKLATSTVCKGADVYYWTDSEIALCWLQKEPSRLKVFVANRVAKIQRNTPIERWSHVRSEHNPADLLSRGMSAKDLLKAQLWWQGPAFIRDAWYTWTPWRAAQAPEHSEDVEAEVRQVANCPISAVLVYKTKPHRQEANLLLRCRTLERLFDATVRVMKMARRWLRRIRQRTTHSSTLADFPGPDDLGAALTCEQRDFALKYWVEHQQRTDFANEYAALSKKQQVRSDSRLRADAPCLVDGLMRVWGRLDNMEADYDVKHPMILDGKSHLATLLIADAHEKLAHGTAAMMRVYLRQRFHIVGGRVAIRKYCHNCLTCARQNAKVPSQMMSDLPAVRVNPAKAFHSTGLDYAGPFSIRRGRGRAMEKAYIAIFVCMVTKAIHVEVANDMTTDAFLAALDRFIAIRAGQVRHIYCDNGRNFVGAERMLREATASWESPETADRAAHYGIT